METLLGSSPTYENFIRHFTHPTISPYTNSVLLASEVLLTIMHYILYTGHHKLHAIMHHKLYTIQYTLHIAQYALHSAHYLDP